jgi:hypothetical protein
MSAQWSKPFCSIFESTVHFPRAPVLCLPRPSVVHVLPWSLIEAGSYNYAHVLWRFCFLVKVRARSGSETNSCVDNPAVLTIQWRFLHPVECCLVPPRNSVTVSPITIPWNSMTVSPFTVVLPCPTTEFTTEFTDGISIHCSIALSHHGIQWRYLQSLYHGIHWRYLHSL